MTFKEALHSLDRLQERTSLDPEIISTLQAQADTLDLPEGHYYMPLKDQAAKLVGFAAFKTVPDWPKPKLVLATVLGPDMHPKGSNISHLMNVGHAEATPYIAPDLTKTADFDTDAYNAELSPQQRAALHRRFNYFAKTLRRKGVETGTAHKRILIPKDKLTANDIMGLGFEPVTIAIPEAGQDQFSSYRHPDNKFHIHSHPEGWTMHEDRHAASTMLAKHEPTLLGKTKALAMGMPHLVTEGIPGLGYYLKGQIGGTKSTAENVLEDLDPKVIAKFEHLKHSPTWEPTEKAAMNKYADGQQDALEEYGVEKPQIEKKTHTPWWPAALAAGAAGLGMYKHMRTPSFVKNNPFLKRMQQQGAQHGFHEIVDVSRIAPEDRFVSEGFDPEWKRLPWHKQLGLKAQTVAENAYGHANEALTPEVSPDGTMSPWNRFSMWLRHGEGAIPVASRSSAAGKDRVWIPGQEGPVDIKGVTYGRHTTPAYSDTTPFSKVVRGGVDLEGPPSTLKALHKIDTGGKFKEFEYWNKHAPGFMPETQGDVTKYLSPNHDRLMQTPAGRVRAIEEVQKNMRKHFGTEGGSDFIVKPDLGLQSGGQLPNGGDNWAKQLSRFEKHMADPAQRAAYHKAKAENDVALAHYLKENDLYEGATLDHLLRNPKGGVVLQRHIPDYDRSHEFRVHVINGEAPKSLIDPRHVYESTGNIARNHLGVPFVGDVDYGEIQQLAQDYVSKLPENERRGLFGLDVHYNPETKQMHLVESNPTQMAGHDKDLEQYLTGGTSGFLGSEGGIPWSSHVLSRHATGRHTQPVALGGALGAAGAAGLGAHLLTPSVDDDDQR